MSRNFRKFLLLWFGELISSVGGGLTSFGLEVYGKRMEERENQPGRKPRAVLCLHEGKHEGHTP